MVLSRIWYLALALALGGAVAVLFMATAMYNTAGTQAMSDALAADSSAVDWYLRDDSRKRSSALIPAALNSELRGALTKASADDKVARDVRDKAIAALRKVAKELPDDVRFDAMWAVDAGGRVIASAGYDHTEDWELGGFALVADALHGWIRDDAWVWKGRIYRVVARPVEQEAGSEPVGAVIGAKVVDDMFARGVSERTGAAVAFYAENARVASGAPEAFDKASLDVITADLKALEGDKNYTDKGRSEVRVLGAHLGVVYARLPGEAYELGAGYAVGRVAVSVNGPLDFLNKADANIQKLVPIKLIGPAALLLGLLGLLFSYFEHTRHIGLLRAEARRLAKGETDVLSPSRLRGSFKKIAAEINDGIDKIVEKGGGVRKAANLEKVLGPIPAEPSMSAFALPDSAPATQPRSLPSSKNEPKGLPKARELPKPDSAKAELPKPEPKPEPEAEAPASDDVARRPPPPKPPPPAPAEEAQAEPAADSIAPEPVSAVEEVFDEVADWKKVYEEFVATKQKCGEATTGLTFEKFRGTLQRNKDALVAKHGVGRVKFTVYVKEGKAALKATPVKA